jgi:chromosome segregation ATPase
MQLTSLLLAALLAAAMSFSAERGGMVLDALLDSAEAGKPATSSSGSFSCPNPLLKDSAGKLQKQIDAANGQRAGLEGTLATIKSEVQAKQDKLNAAKDKRQAVQNRLLALEARQEAASVNAAKARRARAALHRRLDEQKELLKRMVTDVEDAIVLKQEGKDKIAAIKAQIKQRKEQIQKARQAAHATAEEIKGLSSQKEELSESVQSLEHQVQTAMTEAKEALQEARSTRYEIGNIVLEGNNPVAEAELRASQDALAEAETKRTHLEAHLSGLKAESAQQVTLQEKLTQQKADIQNTIDELTTNTTTVEKDTVALRAKLTDAKAALARLERFEAMAKKATAAIKKQFDDLTAKKADLVQHKIPALETSLQKHEESRDDATARRDKAKEANDELVSQQSKLETDLANLKEKAVELSAESAEVAAALKELNRELKSVRKESKKVNGEILQQREHEGRLGAVIARVQRLVNKATGRIRRIKDAREELSKKRRALIARGECGPGTSDDHCDDAIRSLDDEHRLVLEGFADGRGKEILAAAEGHDHADDEEGDN